MGATEMRQIAHWILEALAARDDDARIEALVAEVESLCAGFPVPAI